MAGHLGEELRELVEATSGAAAAQPTIAEPSRADLPAG